ncbi:flagellar basal-body rod protein FlgG [Candidatus Nucleicultrix amoebiphila]|jgi:flagellar basal-body rod protein FlgG|uniref:Flagellar basal-body rod protein FlgG n=1 Tax=Candidatus Nucleicultrix amoebiphila FS5 TaxID=1414854 RepID=A0A1W6N404_9PROT|nr:flagellar basal-body rod protein FlgG [Candidatus Nucleicultrix amoebiphila]ARN84519.1 flagellar basal body rod protein FlgG [Candidatus Nucleicultrix amoebiphila FS5]
MSLRALNTAATGMSAQQLMLDQIANDLANANTTAYKRKLTVFSTMFSESQKRVGSTSSSSGTIVPSGIQIGLGVQPKGIISIQEQGQLVPTENQYHMAIQGEGYFQIELPSGSIAYTRDGSFTTSPDGTIVTQDGYTVFPGITVPAGSTVDINSNGEVFSKTAADAIPQKIGDMQLVLFTNPGGLESLAGNLLIETLASGTPTQSAPDTNGAGKIIQNYIEGSNVNAIYAVTNLIKAQRGFEMNTKSAKTAEEILHMIDKIGS